MFRSKTTFVLGAGASSEVGLPIGTGLLKSICKLIDIRFEHFGRLESGDNNIRVALEKILDEAPNVEKFNQHLHAARQVLASSEQAISIDNIVDGLEDKRVELVSKLGIARAIHLAEQKSSKFLPLGRDPEKINFRGFSNTWYDSLTKLLCEGRKKSELVGVFENVSFVSFNYDRCVENYLPRSIANYFGADINEVVEAFVKVPIHRPYGIAGPINWRIGSGIAHGFGGGSPEYLVQSAKMLRTFTEGVDNPESLEALKADLSQSERIIFLGSAFHRQNLDLLKTPAMASVRILATVLGVSKSDQREIVGDIAQTFRIPRHRTEQQIELAEMNCSELFDSYWRTLTSA